MGVETAEIVTFGWALGASALIGALLHWLWSTTHHH